MRADRLLSILLLLQVNRRLTARTLAERLEVSERTIYRDMEALGMAGVPVVAERGVGGGWSLLQEYRTNLTGLNEAEIRALFLTRPPRLLADLGLGAAAEGAIIKLLAALPATARDGAEDFRERVYIDAASWGQSEEVVPCLPALQDAVWHDRRVRLGYARGEGQVGVERVVDPLGLVAKGSVWYLVAAVEGAEGSVRTYRVGRIRVVEVLPETFKRPADFDLATFWRESSARFVANLPRYQVVLRAHPEAVERMRGLGRFTRIEEVGAVAESASATDPRRIGWLRVVLNCEDEHNAREYVLGQGARVEVIEPESLRAQVAEEARSLATLYQDQQDQDANIASGLSGAELPAAPQVEARIP